MRFDRSTITCIIIKSIMSKSRKFLCFITDWCLLLTTRRSVTEYLMAQWQYCPSRAQWRAYRNRDLLLWEAVWHWLLITLSSFIGIVSNRTSIGRRFDDWNVVLSFGYLLEGCVRVQQRQSFYIYPLRLLNHQTGANFSSSSVIWFGWL